MTDKARVVEILGRINRAYGRPAPLRKTPPVDELIRTVLSQNTNDANSLAAFRVLKNRFASWEAVLRAGTRRIAQLIKRSGLANIKARRIKGVLAEIRRREGRISLSILERLDPGSSLEYLISLKGVGPKTAACVLLFSFGRPVMPVDTHIFRVAKRLGLIGKNTKIGQAHELLTRLLTPRRGPSLRSGPGRCRKARDLIYEFHLGIIEHGRRTCKAQNPRCGFCVLYHMCQYSNKIHHKQGR